MKEKHIYNILTMRPGLLSRLWVLIANGWVVTVVPEAEKVVTGTAVLAATKLIGW